MYVCYQVERLKDLYSLKSTPYDSSNGDHESMLLTLWDIVYPQVVLHDRVTSQWKQLGFQVRRQFFRSK